METDLLINHESIKLDDLPYDIFVNILNNLNYKDIIYLSQVNKKLNDIANDEMIWKMKLIKDIEKWKVIDSQTYPKDIFNQKSSESDEIISYKNIYLNCCPDIITKKEILEKLSTFQQAQNKFQLTSTSEHINMNSNRDHSNNLTLSSLSSLSMPFVVFGQLKDYIYRNVFNYPTLNESGRNSIDNSEFIPKIVMFGPGLETTTSCLVTNILWKSEFKTIGMIPGKDGYGSGIKLRLFNHKPFNLTILYTNVSKVRNSNNHELESNKLILSKNDKETNQIMYELQPQVKEACADASGFIYVIDNKHLSMFETNKNKKISEAFNNLTDPTVNYIQELSVLMKEANRELPLLVLSCSANDQNTNMLNNQSNEKIGLSCAKIVNKLKLYDLNCQWQIRNCQIFENKMKDIIIGFEWLIGKLEQKYLIQQAKNY